MIVVTKTRKMKLEMRAAKGTGRVISNNDLAEDFLQKIIPWTVFRNNSIHEFPITDEFLEEILDWGGEYAFLFRTGSKHEIWNPKGETLDYYFCKEIL